MIFDWHVAIGYLGAVLAIVSIAPYIKDILHGSTRPNTISWALWVFILAIAVSAQASTGFSLSLLFIIGDLVGTSVVLGLCLYGFGYQEYGLTELICLSLAIVAIVSWRLSSQPILALLFSILADFMAALPTVIKAHKDPWSEYPFGWFVLCVAATFGILSSRNVTFANSAFSVYLLFINGLIGILSLMGRYAHKPNKYD